MFKENNTHSTGRPLGSLNKAPKRETLVQLLNNIVDEFLTDYNTLSKDEKIAILKSFRHLYGSVLFDAVPAPEDIRVTIIKPINN